MIVVSDTSAISNLLQVDLLHLLNLVYGKIIIPKAVYKELCEIDSQKQFIDSLNWIEIESPSDFELIKKLEADLDSGESEAIALAIEFKADFLIIDERIGRKIAESLGIKIVGLLGTLLKAKENGFIKTISPVLEDLSQNAGFHINPQLRNYILQLANEA
jgi:uncharacterized protein